MATLDELFPDGLPEGVDWDALKHILGDGDLTDMDPADVGYPDNETIAARLTELTLKVREGDEAEKARAGLMRLARQADLPYWTQGRIADLCGITQQAVAKSLKDGPKPPEFAIDPPYIVGRILAVAAEIADRFHQNKTVGVHALSERLADKMNSGRYPMTPMSLATLRKLMDKDLERLKGRPGSVGMYRDLRAVLDECDMLLPEPPVVMYNVQDGGRVILGYHQQRAAFNQARERAKAEKAAQRLTPDDTRTAPHPPVPKDR